MTGLESVPSAHCSIPLSLPDVSGWKGLPIIECAEPMEPLGIFSDNSDIATSSIYLAEHTNSPYGSVGSVLPGALITPFVRESVTERLREAQRLLPANHFLIVLDSYRSLEVQKALYDHYLNSLRQLQTDWLEDQLSMETQKFVSLPSQDPTRPSPHNTGGAVDLAVFRLPESFSTQLKAIDDRLRKIRPNLQPDPTPEQEAYDPSWREHYLLEMGRSGIVRQRGKLLNFGTPFDHGGPESASNYLEHRALEHPLTDYEVSALGNRRLLYGVMTAAGLQAYPDEWWHYNAPETQMGAKAAGLDHAEYGAAILSSENVRFEDMRRRHQEGIAHIHTANMQGLQPRTGHRVVDDLFRLSELALRTVGDPRITKLDPAAVIEAVR